MATLDDEIREGVDRETVETVRAMGGTYKYGWDTDIEMEYAPKGVNPDIVRLISEKNGEPEWMTEWRLSAFERWEQMEEPDWAMVDYPKIDFQDQYYYARPKSMEKKPESLDDVDPKLLETYKKLGIPLKEQMILAGVEGAEDIPAEGRKVAVDAVFDSVSVGTTFKDELAKAGDVGTLDLRPLGHQNGLFSVLALSKDQIQQLRDDHGIYMAGSGRLNIAGLHMGNIGKFVAALEDVTT